MTVAGAVTDQASLMDAARNAASQAYCPYSGFPVGAAVKTEIGIITGCNVENASYGLAMCAERNALFAAVACGAKRISELAVSCIAAAADGPVAGLMPCGACRQVMAELMSADAVVHIDKVGTIQVTALLPEPFRLETARAQ